MAANRISVSSMRVPAGARACSRIWPESTAGKKSWPTSHPSPIDAEEEAPESQQHAPAMAQGPIQQADIAEPERFEDAG